MSRLEPELWVEQSEEKASALAEVIGFLLELDADGDLLSLEPDQVSGREFLRAPR